MSLQTGFIHSRKAVNSLARRATAAGGLRSMSLGIDLARKEKVEEDRYIRHKEHKEYLVRKAASDSAQAAKELSVAEAKAKALHDATTLEVFNVLALTGEKVSDKCIENLSDWKLGHE